MQEKPELGVYKGKQIKRRNVQIKKAVSFVKLDGQANA